MATELLRGRPRESLAQIISFVGARRRELKASAGQRLLLLEERDALAETRGVELEARLGRIEAQLERARLSAARQREFRGARIDQLKEQVEILRDGGPPLRGSFAEMARSERSDTGAPMLQRLGSALMYVGGLLVLWVVLLELGFALGLS